MEKLGFRPDLAKNRARGPTEMNIRSGIAILSA